MTPLGVDINKYPLFIVSFAFFTMFLYLILSSLVECIDFKVFVGFMVHEQSNVSTKVTVFSSINV